MQSYLRWLLDVTKPINLDPDAKRSRLVVASLVTFIFFQTVFTVFVKITGDVYGSNYAFFDTQFMNIVYLGLCVPFWLLSVALKSSSVRRCVPSFLRQFEIRQYFDVRDFAYEQLWIVLTSLLDSIAALLYGIGGNGSSGPFQSMTSNFGPFLIQLLIYPLYRRQREARAKLCVTSPRWLISSIVSILGLAGGLLATIYTPQQSTFPNGVGYPCSVVCFLVAALCTTLSWHIKEYLYASYQTDAIHLNTLNAAHMVWMTFPMFIVQTQVPSSWTSCTTTGTIQGNFAVGWKCMRMKLSFNAIATDGFEYGCSAAGWSEWIYAIATWMAGMGQFGFTRYVKSSVIQFSLTVLTAAMSTAVFWIAHGEGIHVAPRWYNIFGVAACCLFFWIFAACERDVLKEQADADELKEEDPVVARLLKGGETRSIEYV